MTKNEKLKLCIFQEKAIQKLIDALNTDAFKLFLCPTIDTLYYRYRITSEERSFLKALILANRPKNTKAGDLAYWIGGERAPRKKYLEKLKEKVPWNL